MRRVGGRWRYKEACDVVKTWHKRAEGSTIAAASFGKVCVRLISRVMASGLQAWRDNRIASVIGVLQSQKGKLQRQVSRQKQSLTWWRHVSSIRTFRAIFQVRRSADIMQDGVWTWARRARRRTQRMGRLKQLIRSNKDLAVHGATSLLFTVRRYLPPVCQHPKGRKGMVSAIELLCTGFGILRCIVGWRAAMVTAQNGMNNKDGVFVATRQLVARHVEDSAKRHQAVRLQLFFRDLGAVLQNCVPSERMVWGVMQRNWLSSRRHVRRTQRRPVGAAS